MFDRSQSVTNGIVAGVVDPGPMFFCLYAAGVSDPGYKFRNEFQATAINVRRQNCDAHAFAFGNEDRNFVGVVDLIAQ